MSTPNSDLHPDISYLVRDIDLTIKEVREEMLNTKASIQLATMDLVRLGDVFEILEKEFAELSLAVAAQEPLPIVDDDHEDTDSEESYVPPETFDTIDTHDGGGDDTGSASRRPSTMDENLGEDELIGEIGIWYLG